MSTVPFRLLSFIEFQEAIGKILHFIKKTQVLLIFLMMALMADTQVCKKTVWHWKVKATQNFCSGEYNFAPTIEQGNGSNALKKNCGDEGPNIDSWPTYERRSRKRRGTHLKMTWGTTKIAGNEEAGRSLMDSYQRPGNADSILCAHLLWLDLRQTNWYIEMESIEETGFTRHILGRNDVKSVRRVQGNSLACSLVHLDRSFESFFCLRHWHCAHSLNHSLAPEVMRLSLN